MVVTLSLNEQQVTNLMSYLNRAEIKGSEAPSWMNLVNTIVTQVGQQQKGE